MKKLLARIFAAREGRPPAVIIDPMTGVPDFDGYRPREWELPQQQPEAEMIEHTVQQESAEEILAAVRAAHAARRCEGGNEK